MALKYQGNCQNKHVNTQGHTWKEKKLEFKEIYDALQTSYGQGSGREGGGTDVGSTEL